uniref:Uncharacterized protein n=1 Tax=Sus scrofa TaxID=9823 RepID=A0A4X1VMM0_PIG
SPASPHPSPPQDRRTFPKRQGSPRCVWVREPSYLPRLCLWCHWAPRHHPAKCHSRL